MYLCSPVPSQTVFRHIIDPPPVHETETVFPWVCTRRPSASRTPKALNDRNGMAGKGHDTALEPHGVSSTDVETPEGQGEDETAVDYGANAPYKCIVKYCIIVSKATRGVHSSSVLDLSINSVMHAPFLCDPPPPAAFRACQLQLTVTRNGHSRLLQETLDKINWHSFFTLNIGTQD